MAALAVTTTAAVTLGVLYARRPRTDTGVAHTYIKPMANSSFIFSGTAAGFALAPDGRLLAYVGSTPDGKSVLWVRPMDSLQAQPLAGTEGATYPFWSPDSRFIGFFAGGKLKKIESSGGPPFTICDASDGRGGTWNREGDILLTPSVNTTIFRKMKPPTGGPISCRTAVTFSISRGAFFLPEKRLQTPCCWVRSIRRKTGFCFIPTPTPSTLPVISYSCGNIHSWPSRSTPGACN